MSDGMSIAHHPPVLPGLSTAALPAAEQDTVYTDISHLIDRLQAIDEDGHREIAVSLLMITRWLYVAARQCQTDAELYRQAAECARMREREIKDLLVTSLLLARALEIPDPPRGAEPVATSNTEQSGGLRAYLQRVLGRIQQDFQGSDPPAQLGDSLVVTASEGTSALPVPRPPPVLPPPEIASAMVVDPARSPDAITPEIPSAADPQLVVYCLGAFKAYWGNRPINRWYGLKGMMIFKYLLANRKQPVPKDLLMELFWPEMDPEAARRNLHQAVYSLRRTLRRAHQQVKLIEFENDCYQLNPAVSVWLDVDEFQRHRQDGLRLEQARRLPEALVAFSIAESLYHADFLEEDLYEEWTLPHRQHLRDTYQDLAGRLSEHYYNQSEFTAAIAICRRLIRLDSCNEEAYRRLMKCYLAQGQRHLAIRQYLTCVDALKTELNITPSQETVILYEQLTQHMPDAAPRRYVMPHSIQGMAGIEP